jgi:hypothetical protein
MPAEFGMAACIEAAGIGAAGRDADGSAEEAMLESAALSSFAPVKGFAAASAIRLNAGIRETANAAVAIILTLNLMFASATVRCDCLSISSPDELGETWICQTSYRLKLAESALEADSAKP